MSRKLNFFKQTQKNVENKFRVLNLIYSNFEKFYNIKNIVFNNKKMIYREMHFFYRRIKDYIIIKRKDIVRTNLSICFRKFVLF